MDNALDGLVSQAIVEKSLDAVVVINRAGSIVFWNAAAQELFGYQSSEVLGKYVHDILPAHDLRQQAGKSFDEFRENGSGPIIGSSLLVRALRKDGAEIHVSFSPNTILVEGELYVFAFLRDVSDLISLQEKLKHQAMTDELTGVLNRRAFLQQAEAVYGMSVKSDEPLALLMMDIDYFKKINDLYGHPAGDATLQSFAKNITGIIRKSDIFGRVGGEEFSMILINTPLQVALDLAERIRQATEKLIVETDRVCVKLTVSIGVTMLEHENDSIYEMQKRCDNELYKAKNKGRNCISYSM